MSDTLLDEPSLPASPAAPVPWRRRVARAAPLVVALLLSLFVVRTYARIYDPQFGWTKTIFFGREFASRTLPLLQQTPHYTDPSPGTEYGYDGQFYAQIALDPSLRDPAFRTALDSPTYRSRRIGLPALAFCLGLGNPWWTLQAYALSNLLFWFVLLGACWRLLKLRTPRPLLCFGAGMLSCGVLTSMRMSLADLPAAALAFAAVAVGARGGLALFATALLTRETSLLAAPALADLRPPWRARDLRRPAIGLALSAVPLALWLLYVNHRFGQLGDTAGGGNFALPLQAMAARFAQGVQQCSQAGWDHVCRAPWRFKWLYADFLVHQLLTIAAISFQGLFLLLRRDVRSPFWRMGVCYLALCLVLGPAVWDEADAATRVLIPLTICFYLRLAGERAAWFWPFFFLGGLSIPYAVHKFWVWSA